MVKLRKPHPSSSQLSQISSASQHGISSTISSANEANSFHQVTQDSRYQGRTISPTSIRLGRSQSTASLSSSVASPSRAMAYARAGLHDNDSAYRGSNNTGKLTSANVGTLGPQLAIAPVDRMRTQYEVQSYTYTTGSPNDSGDARYWAARAYAAELRLRSADAVQAKSMLTVSSSSYLSDLN